MIMVKNRNQQIFKSKLSVKCHFCYIIWFINPACGDVNVWHVNVQFDFSQLYWTVLWYIYWAINSCSVHLTFLPLMCWQSSWFLFLNLSNIIQIIALKVWNMYVQMQKTQMQPGKVLIFCNVCFLVNTGCM